MLTTGNSLGTFGEEQEGQVRFHQIKSKKASHGVESDYLTDFVSLSNYLGQNDHNDASHIKTESLLCDHVSTVSF